MPPKGRGLGRVAPPDDTHIRKYHLTRATFPSTPTPVCIGINWYEGFDFPVELGGKFYLPEPRMWGGVLGGHEICILSPHLKDSTSWWRFYDQGAEGACVGFALSRMMSLLNRHRYDALWLYREAQLVDDWADTPPQGGTSGRAGCDILRDRGHRVMRSQHSSQEDLKHGIEENRWARSVEDIARCLSPDDEGALVLNLGYVVLLNSWGDDYEHYVRLDLEGLNRLVFNEDGDATMVTDRTEVQLQAAA